MEPASHIVVAFVEAMSSVAVHKPGPHTVHTGRPVAAFVAASGAAFVVA